MAWLTAKPQYFDLTHSISESTPVYPGDPHFKRDQLQAIRIGEEGSYNLCEIHMGNHTGTHIDFPAHVIVDGKTSSDYSINDLVGEGCIIEVPSNIACITGNFIRQKTILKGDIVFFKSNMPDMHLDSSAAEALVENGVRIVGIDTMSIDSIDSAGVPMHHYLLSREVLIVEGLNLANMEEGRGEIIIAPLKIANIDGVPVRVLMRRE